MAQQHWTGTPGPEPDEHRSIGQLIKDISADLSTLVRGEIALVKADLSRSAKISGKGVGLFAGAGVLTAVAGLLITFCFVYALSETGLPLWACFLIVAVVYLIVAAIAAFLGKRELEKFKTAEPKSVVQAKETVEVLKTRHPV